MNDWTKGYAMLQPMDEIYDHMQKLQDINAVLLETCKGVRNAIEGPPNEGRFISPKYFDREKEMLDQAIAKAVVAVLEQRKSAEVIHCLSLEEVRAETLLDIEAAIVDLGLPDSDGLATLDSVRELIPDVPIVVFTARDDLGEDALEKGAHYYLLKGLSTPLDLPSSLIQATGRKNLKEAMDTVPAPRRKTVNMAFNKDHPKAMIALGQHLQLLATEG